MEYGKIYYVYNAVYTADQDKINFLELDHCMIFKENSGIERDPTSTLWQREGWCCEDITLLKCVYE